MCSLHGGFLDNYKKLLIGNPDVLLWWLGWLSSLGQSFHVSWFLDQPHHQNLMVGWKICTQGLVGLHFLISLIQVFIHISSVTLEGFRLNGALMVSHTMGK